MAWHSIPEQSKPYHETRCETAKAYAIRCYIGAYNIPSVASLPTPPHPTRMRHRSVFLCASWINVSNCRTSWDYTQFYYISADSSPPHQRTVANTVRPVPDVVITVWVCSWWWVRVSSETCRAVCRKYNKTVYSRILLDNYWHWFTMHGPMDIKYPSLSIHVPTSVYPTNICGIMRYRNVLSLLILEVRQLMKISTMFYVTFTIKMFENVILLAV